MFFSKLLTAQETLQTLEKFSRMNRPVNGRSSRYCDLVRSIKLARVAVLKRWRIYMEEKNESRETSVRKSAPSDLQPFILQPYPSPLTATAPPLKSHPPLRTTFSEFILNNRLPLLVYSCVVRQHPSGRISRSLKRASPFSLLANVTRFIHAISTCE